MQKSNEERLADIENSINRLTKMQGYMFRTLLILRKTVHLFEARQATGTSALVSMESRHRRRDRSLMFLFGGLTAISVANSIFSIDFTALDFTAKFVLGTFYTLGVICFILACLEYYWVESQSREATQELTRTKEVLDVAREEDTALEDEMARILAGWKELFPDDLASEPRPED
jgi:hypothetical protein